MERVEQIDYKGYKINIYPDEDAQRPDNCGDDEMFLVHYHRNCQIENKAVTENEIAEWYRGKKTIEKQYWIWPVAAYIHSGIVLSLGSGRHFPDYNWDVSHVGAVLVKRYRGLTEKKARKYAEGLIDEWNDYLSGNVYGYTIEGEDNEEGGCWGFEGDWETSGIIEEAKAEIDRIKETVSV